MSKEKKKKTTSDLFDGDFDPFEAFEKRSPKDDLGGGGGYSIQVTYDGDRPIVIVETHGNVDKGKLRDRLEEQYPKAKIIGLDEEKPLIREIKDDERQE
ncbi:MAG: hypothetical protein ACFE7E_07595 [Candidatus Hodarchaeota archaeon]